MTATVLAARGAADTERLARALPSHPVREFTELTELPAHERAHAAVLVIRSGHRIDATALDRLPQLRHVVRAGSGLDGIDIKETTDRGITVHRYAEASAPAVAEWTLAALLALVRRIPLGSMGLAGGAHLKSACMAPLPLSAMNVAVWGAGPVGTACAALIRGLAADVRFADRPGIDPALPRMPAAALSAWAHAHIDAVPGTTENVALFGREFLHRARHRAPHLVVAGRLSTIDVNACLDALDDGRLAGLAIDPVDQEHIPLLPTGRQAANLLLTPHIGAQRADVRERLDTWVSALVADLMTRRDDL
ncbi:NAD(P)-dependent oxidoreductase [Streptomyces sp. NPDC101455]|uniref:NAD(P)-dependent oxidoreductase n=1 Tax=Streptomyces sp. NPDC101455 TaxID=3366142 RepID=UPI0037F4943F